MYIQAYANQNITNTYLPTFKRRKKDENYFAYMSRHTDDIMQGSLIIGGVSGAIAARKNADESAVIKIMRHIGFTTLGLFGFTSLTFALPESIKK